MTARDRAHSREILLGLGVALLAAVICGWLYRIEINQLEQRWLERESARTSILSKLLADDFKHIADDLEVLASSDGLRAYLVSGQPGDMLRAANRAAIFSRQQPAYDQIRYLDETGKEILRLNQGGHVVAKEGLQDKADRSYFKNSRDLAPGQIYISEFDLNVEGGAVEQPLKPMVRLATPVFDAAGHRRGIFILNYLGSDLISHLENFVPAFQQRFRLLNARGDWIKGPRPADEWGSLLPDRAGRSLSQTNPTLWARLRREPAGHAKLAGGTLTWERFDPRESVRSEGAARTMAADEFFIVASEMTETEWLTAYRDVRRVFLIVGGVLVILLIVGGWFFHSRQEAVERLRKSQEMFERLFEQSPDAIILVDRNSHVIRANAKTETLFGWTRRELAGRPVDQLLAARNAGKKNPALSTYFAAPSTRGSDVEVEWMGRRKEGGAFPVDLMLSPIETESGAQALVTLRDSSARVHSEQTLRLFNEELETRVQERTRQLETLNRELNREMAERNAVTLVLREREQQLSLITDNFPGLVSRMDRDFRYLFVSATYEKWFGRPSGEMLGRTLAEVFGEENFRRAEPFARRALAGERMTFENHVVTSKGEKIPLFVAFIPDRDSAGQVRALFVVAIDISERKAAEEALRQSEHRFRELLEHSADGISLIDANNNILYVSPSVAAVEGYTTEELIGRNGLENTHPDDLTLIAETVKRLLTNPGQPMPVLWRRRHKHGHWIWLEGVATNLLHDPDVRGIVTNYRDVTARKQAEVAVRDSEQRFRTLTENLPDIVLRFDRQFRLLYANPARERLTGQSLGDSTGKTLAELGTIPANAERFQAALARVFDTRQTERLELTYPTPGGITAWESTLVAEPGADGSVASVLVLSHDITERNRADEEIRRLNASLEERVRARTAQIEAVNRELEAFSYSVSHDLRAPLRHIDGFSGLLAKRSAQQLDPQGQRYLATISEAARQMGRLIDDLLSFSRMGRAPLNAVSIDHNALVAAVIRDGRYDQAVPPITWAVAPLPRVLADAPMLRQVWFNLIDNAVKYSGKSPSPRVEIGSQPVNADQQQVFFVRDNGVGFDPKYASKLFGVFQRLHGPEEFPGTGVGLANVLRIVTRHGGRAWAESRLGEGATFYFSLPVGT